MPRLAALCLVLAAPSWAGPAFAGDFAPGGNAGTLARAFALPALGDGAVLARGRGETRWTLDLTNESAVEGNCAAECIVIDGETARLRFSHRRGLGGGWDLAFEVSALDRGGGFLDGWIEDWHDALGLPQGGRDTAVDDQYRFHYEGQNTVLLDQARGGTGMGDATFTIGRRLGGVTTLRAMVKLPTGDEDSLEGGTQGGALWLERAFALPRGWSGYLAAGTSYSERGTALPGLQNRQVPFGGFGLAIPVTPTIRLAAQLQAHGRLFDGSALTPLARAGAPLTLGLQFRTGARGSFELGFQEDPSVNGSPDFAAYLSIRSTAFSPPQ
jgi:hypothetical protein